MNNITFPESFIIDYMMIKLPEDLNILE